MDIGATVALMYDRLGRHVAPIPEDGFMIQEGRRLAVRTGVCARTGVEGPIVDWEDRPDGGKRTPVPTSAKLLWFLRKLQRIGESPARLSKGQFVVFTETEILTNFPFAQSIENMCLIDRQNEILRAVLREDGDFLFLAFSDSTAPPFSSRLRWSRGKLLEINGRLTAGEDEFENTTIDLHRADALMKEMTKQAATDIAWLLQKPERTNKEQKELKAKIDKHRVSLEALALLYAASPLDIRLAHRLWNK